MDYMLRALSLAARAVPHASPNPAVGAVLVKDGRIVGEGFTQPPGGDHAEVVALRRAGDQARGASLYVTLEPCCHFGRTPPCTDALVGAGVAAVHMAMRDPSPWVAGRGRQALEAAGIRIAVGEREHEARHLNEAYLKWATCGLPFVTAKFASTLDGKTATRTGSSRWISSPSSRERVGRLRGQVDAVVVGVRTVLTDDPQLTARDSEDRLLSRQPLRVVLDTAARTPPSARLLAATPGAGRVVVVSSRDADPASVAQLERAGAEVVRVPACDQHLDARAAFQELALRGVTSALVESGGQLLAGLLEARLVDRVVAFIAPKLVGGRDAPTPVEGLGLAEMSQALALHDVRYERVGDDLMVTGELKTCSPES